MIPLTSIEQDQLVDVTAYLSDLVPISLGPPWICMLRKSLCQQGIHVISGLIDVGTVAIKVDNGRPTLIKMRIPIVIPVAMIIFMILEFGLIGTDCVILNGPLSSEIMDLLI